VGGAIIGEMEAVMDGFSNVCLGEGHGRSPVFVKKLALSHYFVNANLYKSKKIRMVGLWNDLPWIHYVFQAEKV